VGRIDRLKGKGYNLNSLESTFGFLMHAAWRETLKIFNDYFDGTDITPQAYSILLLVEGNPGCTPGDLSEIMGITSNNMTRLLDDLVARGLMSRCIDGKDRRARLLRLTEEGMSVLRDLASRHAAYEAHFHDRLGKERIVQLCDILARFD